jgi:hypothetical protein
MVAPLYAHRKMNTRAPVNARAALNNFATTAQG